jgi:hypothetical protein
MIRKEIWCGQEIKQIEERTLVRKTKIIAISQYHRSQTTVYNFTNLKCLN